MKLTKKNIFVLLSVCILSLVVALSFQHGFNASRDLTTDSGFDSDFGGGSSGGGSSSSSGYGGSSYDSSDGSGIFLDIPIEFIIISFVIAFIVSMSIILPIKVSRSKENGKVDYFDAFLSSIVYGFLSTIINIVIFVTIDSPIITIVIFSSLALGVLLLFMLNKSIMAKRDAHFFMENFHDPSIVKEAYDIYVRIQKAWSKNNIEDVRDVLSSEMYNMYNSQIKTMIRKKQRNAMSDFKFVKGSIYEHKNIDGQDRYVVILQVYCKDYLVNDETNKVIRGSSRRTNDYIYSLTFVKNKEVDVDKCPNCQGELSLSGQNVECPYCGSIIKRKSDNMVLVEKKMLMQRIKRFY